jgi:DNA excision repair protein ERCC-2
MTEGEQQELLHRFQAMDQAVLGIVMGGVFGESIDLGSNALAGVVVVSLALPPRDLVKTLTSEHFDQTHGSGWGQQVAYLQPALSRIVQAAGRVIRGPQDRGVLCLVDPRFADPKLAGFFPEHWRVQLSSAKDAEIYLNAFWSNDLSSAGD